jgi:hypothetical protein
MKNPKLIFGLIVIVICLTIIGCSSRKIIYIDDHPTRPTTNIETIKTTIYPLIFIPFAISWKHEFWKCEDRENALICEKVCDKGGDLICPTKWWIIR